jgi:hypothetical protein
VRKSDRYRELENKFRKLAETSPQDRSKYLSAAEGWRSLADTSDFVASQQCEIQERIDAIAHRTLSTKNLALWEHSG